MKKITFTGMNIPVGPDAIEIFEQNNPDYFIMVLKWN